MNLTIFTHVSPIFRIYSKLVELAKIELQQMDRRALRKNLENMKKSPVPEDNQGRPKSSENVKSPTRKYPLVICVSTSVLNFYCYVGY